MEEQKATSEKHNNQAPPPNAKVAWVETEDTTNDYSAHKTSDVEEEFKKEHQQYLALRLQRQKEERKQKIQQFGDSSSDEEQQMTPPILVAQSPVKVEVKTALSQQGSDRPKSPAKLKKEKVHKQNPGHAYLLEKQEKVSIMVNSKKGVDQWLEDMAMLNDKLIVVPGHQFPYYDVNKLKLIFSDIGDRCFKLKISWKNQEFIFGASNQKQHRELPEAFFIFTKIVCSKLVLMGKKPLKHLQLSSSGVPQIAIKNSLIYGKVLKKSRVIGRWQEFFAVINREGFSYYKKINDKPNLLVPRTTITELWTRFQFQEEWLVVKLFQGGHKIELGIPFSDELTQKGWLFHLYGLIFKA